MTADPKVLLVYPQYPVTFWSFTHVLKFISKKAAFPPLGLLTVAALLPPSWEKKLVDMNVTPLNDSDIAWADYVFIGAMIVQKDSVRPIIARCRELGKKVVAGGPLFTTGHDQFEGVDHFVLGEAEITLPRFLEDLEKGEAAPLYASQERPDINKTPVPQWDLIRMKDYAFMAVQYSRGCPFNCEFCDITLMNGRVPRTKAPLQTMTELDALYERGWRGQVFIVDDNFIGKKKEVRVLLSELKKWMQERKNPFTFLAEASIDLADDDELMKTMAEANFQRVFVGLETPVEESLHECCKFQNKGRDLVSIVKKIQNHGMEVLGGFIVGFDNDPPSVFERQISFIQKSGVVTAMVGILTALPGTILHSRLLKENRLLKGSSGDNVDGTLNFIPQMSKGSLIEGYLKILRTIYSPKEYYERILTFLKEYRPAQLPRVQWVELKALVKSFWYIGVVGNSRKYYWKLIAWSLLRRPKLFPKAVTLAICGFHLQKIADDLLSRVSLRKSCEDLPLNS
ncbi:MAG: B12-binding domain-containing radical SAM protein [Candidatus Eremiobacteraeota bacterium]|nr:B12-binding domain-containing radical SAM protein [Candidatus Eremiobacteraeota bacterium]